MTAGLTRRTDRGDVVDAFRDRVVFPIIHGDDIVGFIGRRNPTKDDNAFAGPKYLNTRATVAFTKAEQLYGLTEEGRAALDAGARPVLVEGPLDAIAVSIASLGEAVGIAPMGTAFTAAQAAQLRPLFKDDRSRIVVATDNDPAGQESARRAFWELTRLGADPQQLALPTGQDPADVLRQQGSDALRQTLHTTRPLAEALIHQVIAARAEDLASPATRLSIVREASAIIAALPPESWLAEIDKTTGLLVLPPGRLHIEVIDSALASHVSSGVPLSPASFAHAHKHVPSPRSTATGSRDRHAREGAPEGSSRSAASGRSR
jgi:DNA primase catalytic core